MLGFIVYQLGIFAAQQPTSFLGGTAAAILTFVSFGQSTDVSIIMLKFCGGILAIIGLIIAINGVVAPQQIDAQSFQALQSAIQELQSYVKKLQSSSVQHLKQQFACKFCGAGIDVGEFFCPACGKAQG
jgi:hypothetical protein